MLSTTQRILDSVYKSVLQSFRHGTFVHLCPLYKDWDWQKLQGRLDAAVCLSFTLCQQLSLLFLGILRNIYIFLFPSALLLHVYWFSEVQTPTLRLIDSGGWSGHLQKSTRVRANFPGTWPGRAGTIANGNIQEFLAFNVRKRGVTPPGILNIWKIHLSFILLTIELDRVCKNRGL